MQKINQKMESIIKFLKIINPIFLFILSLLLVFIIKIPILIKFNENLSTNFLLFIFIISFIVILIFLLILIYTLVAKFAFNIDTYFNDKNILFYMATNILFIIIFIFFLPFITYLSEKAFNSDPFKSLLLQFENIKKINIMRFYTIIWILWITLIPLLINSYHCIKNKILNK